MLYLSTRNNTNTYTAYRAMQETCAPDGGQYIPFRLPVFTQEELSELLNGTPAEAVALILNRFFRLQLTGGDVEAVIGCDGLKAEIMNHRLIMAQMWHNPAGTMDSFICKLYSLISGKDESADAPCGWSYIAIEIALLFGLFSTLQNIPEEGIDIAVTAGDFADLVATAYAKEMGLPIRMVVCACNENGLIWDLLNRGELNLNGAVVPTKLPKLDIAQPAYLEYFIYLCLGKEFMQGYLQAVEEKTAYYIDEEKVNFLREDFYSAVVSSQRVDSIISGVSNTNGYRIDPYAALAYGALQDFRAHTGMSNTTVVLTKERPLTAKG